MGFGDVFGKIGGAFNGGWLGQATGGSSPSFSAYGPATGATRQQGLDYAGINANDINQQAATAGQQQRQQNISAYNAALASQRGVNPTLAATSIGNNFANVNAQTGAQTQNIQAQNSWQAAQGNQNALLNYYNTLSQNYNAANVANQQSATASGERAGGIFGKILSDIGQKEPITAPAAGGFGSGFKENGLLGGINSYLSGGKNTGAGLFINDSPPSDKQGSSGGGGLFKDGILGPILQGLFALSDKDQKQEIDHNGMLHSRLFGGDRAGQEQMMAQQGPQATEQFMDTLQPQAYQYREDGTGPDGGKPHIGVMAQDLEKTPWGASAVSDTPEGKAVDVRQLSMMLGAAVGDLHQRLSRMEGSWGGANG